MSSEEGERRQVLQPGQQWASRRHLTAFVRAVRTMLDEVGGRRGRPFTISARCALCLGEQTARGRLAAFYLLLLSHTDLTPKIVSTMVINRRPRNVLGHPETTTSVVSGR